MSCPGLGSTPLRSVAKCGNYDTRTTFGSVFEGARLSLLLSLSSSRLGGLFTGLRGRPCRIVALSGTDKERTALGGSFGGLELGMQRNVARIDWLFGQWLASAAREHHQAVVEPYPWDTAIERAAARLHEAHGTPLFL